MNRRFIHRIRAIVLILFLARNGLAGVDENLATGYLHFYNLEYADAIASFEKAAAQDPASPVAQNGIAQSVLYREMLRTGALDSETVDSNNSFLRRPRMEVSKEHENQFVTAINNALELSRQALDRNPRDMEPLHARAVSFAFRSNWNFLVHKAWRESLSDATASRKCEDQILAINPDDPDAPLGRGVHEYIIGGLPWAWRTLGLLAGFHGDKAKGLATIEQVARYGIRNKVDAEFLLCAFYRRDRLPQKALEVLADLVQRYRRNYILRFEQAKMYGDLGDGKRALAVIDDIQALKQEKAPGLVDVPWTKIYYERATLQFWYNLPRESLANFNKVIAAPDDLNVNTKALSYMRMGQILDMLNERKQAIDSYRKAILYAPSADAAQESRQYIANPYRRS
jgi:tetratricopeptide (TPR) repeat protein